MIALFVLPFILAFAPGAVWALRSGGLRRLWLLCAVALSASLLAALVLSAAYSVPSTWQVVYYSLAFVGPSLLCTTGSLTVASAFARPLATQIVAAFAGGSIGLALGFLVIVYVLGVW